MYITNNIFNIPKNNYPKYSLDNTKSDRVFHDNYVYTPIKCSPLTFQAVYNVKHKSINIPAEKEKLLKQISDLLNIENEPKDILVNDLQQAFQAFRAKIKQQNEILHQIEEIADSRILSQEQKLEKINQLRKEVNHELRLRRIPLYNKCQRRSR